MRERHLADGAGQGRRLHAALRPARPVRRRRALPRRRHHACAPQTAVGRPEAGRRRRATTRRMPKARSACSTRKGFALTDKGAAIQFHGPGPADPERRRPSEARVLAPAARWPALGLPRRRARAQGIDMSQGRPDRRHRARRHRVAPERAGGDRPRRRPRGPRRRHRHRRPADRALPQEGAGRAGAPAPAAGRRRSRRRRRARRRRYRQQRDLPARGGRPRPHLHPDRPGRGDHASTTSTRRCWC